MAIKKVVILNILDKRGSLLCNREMRKKLNIKNINVNTTGKNISILLPSLCSPQGSWLKIGKSGGSEK